MAPKHTRRKPQPSVGAAHLRTSHFVMAPIPALNSKAKDKDKFLRRLLVRSLRFYYSHLTRHPFLWKFNGLILSIHEAASILMPCLAFAGNACPWRHSGISATS
jgi:hypothetical protein